MSVTIGIKARKGIVRGANLFAKTVAVTYGPQGKTVLLERPAGLIATKDGVTVAREISFEDPFMDMGAKVLCQACLSVNDTAGDGTTSTAIVAAEILRLGHAAIVGGHDPMQICRGIQNAAHDTSGWIGLQSKPIQTQEELEQVALVASNYDEEISQLLAEAVMSVGSDGTVLIEDGKSVDTTLSFKDGVEINNGTFVEALGALTERKLENPLVAVIGARLSTVEHIQSMLECASQWPDHPLLILAEVVDGEAKPTILVNDQKGVVKACVVLAPGVGDRKKDFLKDYAALSAATYVSSEVGLDFTNWDASWFGSLKQATCTERKTVLVGHEEVSSLLETRVEELKTELASAVSEYDKDRVQERLASLTGGLAVLSVGGHSEAAMRERRARIEDALGAIRSALETGVLPGGGVSYLRAAENCQGLWDSEEESFVVGYSIFLKALECPIKTLVNLSGVDPINYDDLLAQPFWVGWDTKTNSLRRFDQVPLVVDPTKVVQAVLQSAASVAGSLLTVEAGISLPKNKRP